ncbi:aspartate carbamoyltransferase [Finegoldia magna]|uniref:Aspartate carbamoyltransferase catalytic subunit n=2 Tax=Finegoldia magna TaxID=1260 RepID=PYRB_FINM2|nr:aspartate carbamoyltransferase [Finegoldia magna]B0S198.1 RecName: Full=Aspartate carbamoyltransferase catalytic subunit; AltName: Full=Aspartate transcarbamylase; Short=ATCase [Finegoldia magna ATCC 29328]EGS33807.1 aspartate carbamoyltransferase [Finegoldia magna SY403409CC001050417]KXA08902.1 aspartate carbamoyltransferase [Finegoldia magna]MDU1212925.1 aspartate carbamoyltransferase [Finegoldia magna]MDU4732225.1 aspartate carbamoyltransferase [Finegoldia magna]MDU5363437.1 aspartate c
MLKNRNLINADDFNVEEINEILNLAEEIIKSPSDFSNLCNGKILGTLFFEPSTRTRLSFESAIHRLGGDCIGFSESASSSTSKGESLADTIRTVSNYTDIIAMRNPKEGSAVLASSYAEVPLINAGDGGHQHPTQTLTDLLTIWMTKKKLDNMTIGLCGDLKFGRTVHSLIKAMSRYENNKFILISPEELQVPDYIKMFLKSKNIEFKEVEKMEDVIGELDVLYMTRVQKERFFNEADYVRLKDSYILDNDKMKLATEDLAVLHPLPRVNEIATEVDSDPRAVYFKQVRYGVIVRMALILKLLGVR